MWNLGSIMIEHLWCGSPCFTRSLEPHNYVKVATCGTKIHIAKQHCGAHDSFLTFSVLSAKCCNLSSSTRKSLEGCHVKILSSKSHSNRIVSLPLLLERPQTGLCWTVELVQCPLSHNQLFDLGTYELWMCMWLKLEIASDMSFSNDFDDRRCWTWQSVGKTGIKPGSSPGNGSN